MKKGLQSKSVMIRVDSTRFTYSTNAAQRAVAPTDETRGEGELLSFPVTSHDDEQLRMQLQFAYIVGFGVALALFSFAANTLFPLALQLLPA
ncbi:MAG: hypothetical protein U5N86_04935 [Planctomycetota bacterium]|nr:hypothetical protein [Planctomycetota bacterium]